MTIPSYHATLEETRELPLGGRCECPDAPYGFDPAGICDYSLSREERRVLRERYRHAYAFARSAHSGLTVGLITDLGLDPGMIAERFACYMEQSYAGRSAFDLATENDPYQWWDSEQGCYVGPWPDFIHSLSQEVTS